MYQTIKHVSRKLNNCFKRRVEDHHVLPEEVSKDIIQEKSAGLLRMITSLEVSYSTLAVIKVAIGNTAFRSVTSRNQSSGKGWSETQAINSALFEMVERYCCHTRLKRPDVTTRKITKEEVYVASNNFLPYQRSRVAKDLFENTYWHYAYDLEGDCYLLPYILFFKHLHGSNGMTAGATIEEAILHGVYEVIERHCMTLLLEGRQAETISHNEKNYFKDLSFLGVPCVGLIRKMEDGSNFFVAGCAGNYKEAKSQACLELAQLNVKTVMHDCGMLIRAGGGHRYGDELESSFSTKLINHDPSKYDVSNIDIKEELMNIQKRLSLLGMKIFWIDATIPRVGIPCAIVFIQGAYYNEISRRKQHEFNN